MFERLQALFRIGKGRKWVYAEASLFPEIALELLEMERRDQQMRQAYLAGHSEAFDPHLDQTHTERVKAIVAAIGWPTHSKVGSQGSQAAWLLVQHADHDLAFQKHCLSLMQAVPRHEISPSHLAYLEDRVRVKEGRPQLYGTQFDDSVNFAPKEVEDAKNLERRRRSVGLGTMAQYRAEMQQVYRRKTP